MKMLHQFRDPDFFIVLLNDIAPFGVCLLLALYLWGFLPHA